MNKAPVQYGTLKGFDDPAISEAAWNAMLRNGPTDVIFLTHQYQKTWWEVFGRGMLILIVACRDEQPFAIAPFFSEEGMIFFTGSGGSDYLDFIGNVSEPGVLEGMLRYAQEQVPGFLGFRFYHLPDSSPTQRLLSSITEKNGWELYDEGTWPCPQLSIREFPEQAFEATRKKSLLRHQAWFEREGGIETVHLRRAEDILPNLELFFNQHISRWMATDSPSLFQDPVQRTFYRRLSESLSASGWLRFTRLFWQGRAIAFHFGFHYHGSFLWYKPSFDILLAKHSPGEVLIRQLLLLALDEGAHTFDFGLGNEAFKQRFATDTPVVKVYGIYQENATGNAG